MRRQSSVQNPPASPPPGVPVDANGSLRRQITDALSYFDAQELIDNEQDLDYFAQSDVTNLRYRSQLEPDDVLSRELKTTNRESCGSSRFGDESSFDSPSSRIAQKASSASYSNDHSGRNKSSSSKYDEGVSQQADEDYFRGRSSSAKEAYKSASDNGRTPHRGAKTMSQLEEHEWKSRQSEFVDGKEKVGGSGERGGMELKERRGEFTSERGRDQGSSVAGGAMSAGEEDMELEFRRKAAASMMDQDEESDFRIPNEDEDDDDMDEWLLAQSKKYGVKLVIERWHCYLFVCDFEHFIDVDYFDRMEQVDRVEDAEHILSASMPMGADAGFYSDTGGGANKKRRPSIGHKIGALVGLSKKSSSLTQLQGYTSHIINCLQFICLLM